MRIDYTYFYKRKLAEDCLESISYDVFISSFSKDERASFISSKIIADSKTWLVLPEYHIDEDEYPDGDIYTFDSENESDFITNLWERIGGLEQEKRLCIDATGFLNPYLIFLLKFLKHKGIKKLDIVYSEPSHYNKREQTQFSDETVISVRQIVGFEGNHSSDTSNDYVVINSGYDHKLISNAAEHKDHAKKIQLFGFPPLQADMYQENIIRAKMAEESVGSITNDEFSSLLAPANDPFATANVLSKYIRRINKEKPITNLYLCPLGTKPQAIGVALYYLLEKENDSTSIIYPFCNRYEPETSVGISRIWLYTIEF